MNTATATAAPTAAQRAVHRRQRLVQFLATRKGWVDTAAVAGQLGWNIERAEDELAEAVIDGAVEFNSRASGYRLATTPLCREAARRLVLRKLQRAMLGQWSGDGHTYHVAMAMLKPLPEADGPGQHLVMTQVDIPSAIPRDYRLALQVADAFDTGLLMDAAQQQPQPLAA
jgi:hypothetical protein